MMKVYSPQMTEGGKHGTFLRPKGKGKGIMVSDFLLPWSRLNLYSLPKTRQDELET